MISHSLPVLRLLAERPAQCRLISLGCELLSEQQAFVGAATVQATAHLRMRSVFLSVAAIDVHGLYGCAAEPGVQHQLMDIAENIVLLAA